MALVDRRLVRHVHLDADPPPAGALPDRRTLDRARQAQRLGHVHGAELWDHDPVAIHAEFVICQIEAAAPTLFALELGEADLLALALATPRLKEVLQPTEKAQ